MNIWVTSDTHFGHRNIIDFCKRPWHTVEEMNDGLVDRWNKRVAPSDVVYHLGDVLFGGAATALKYLPRLNGIVKLVPGNHDSRKLLAQYWEVLEPIHGLNYEGKRFVLCHFPLLSWENMGYGYHMLHGHTHGGIKEYPKPVGDYHYRGTHRIMDVGVDPNNWEPLHIDEIIEKLA